MISAIERAKQITPTELNQIMGVSGFVLLLVVISHFSASLLYFLSKNLYHKRLFVGYIYKVFVTF